MQKKIPSAKHKPFPKKQRKYKSAQDVYVKPQLLDAVFCKYDDFRMFPAHWKLEDGTERIIYGYVCPNCNYRYNPNAEKEPVHGVIVQTADGAIKYDKRAPVIASIPRRTLEFVNREAQYRKMGIDPRVIRDADMTTPSGTTIISRQILVKGRTYNI